MEYAAEALQSLTDVMDELNDAYPDDVKHNRMTEFTTQLEDCLYNLEIVLSQLRKNFYIDPVRRLPRDRIDYVHPEVDEELR